MRGSGAEDDQATKHVGFAAIAFVT